MNTKILVAFLIAVFPLAACVPGRPQIFVGHPTSDLGGEAIISGRLTSSSGCVTLRDYAGQKWTLIFPDSARLNSQTGRSDLELMSELYPVNGTIRVSAVGASIKEENSGWSSESLRRLVTPRLPNACLRRVFYVKSLRRNP